MSACVDQSRLRGYDSSRYSSEAHHQQQHYRHHGHPYNAYNSSGYHTATSSDSFFEYPSMDRPCTLPRMLSYFLACNNTFGLTYSTRRGRVVENSYTDTLSDEQKFFYARKHTYTVDLETWITRLCHYTRASGECYFIALMLIETLQRTQPKLVVCDRSFHRIYSAALLVAVKLFDDVFFPNSYYADTFGVPLPELTLLEKSFLSQLNYEGLWVDTDRFHRIRSDFTVCISAASFVPRAPEPSVEAERRIHDGSKVRRLSQNSPMMTSTLTTPGASEPVSPKSNTSPDIVWGPAPI